MDVPDKSIDSKEVELTEADELTPPKSNNQERLIVDVEITFWTHVGWDGVLVMLFSLGIASLYVYITFLYTKNFRIIRPSVWVFVVFAVLYTLFPLMYLFSWTKMAKKSRSKTQVKSGRRDAYIRKLIQVRTFFNINGVLFLWKLYLFEFIENINQLLNIVMMYLCTFPVEVTCSICVIIRVRTDNAILLEQTRISKEKGSNRKNFFRLSTNVKISIQQQERMPKIVSTAFSVYNVVYGLFLLALATAHLLMRPTGCDKKIWARGCVIKIPFCKSLFTPTCDCASLKLENDYKLTALPNSLVDDMTGLRKVFIRNCNLTALPPRMEKLTEMVDFEVSFNRLQRFNVDVGKWGKLNNLYLMYNEISFVHESVWKHLEVTALGLSDNRVVLPSKSGIYMPSLFFLILDNNNMTVRDTIGKDLFPLLTFLFINGNSIEAFPSEDLKDIISYLGVARCKLNSLPSYVSTFKNLKYLDARDNSLRTISKELKHLLRNNDVEAYFSGNVELCDVEEEFDCAPLCSKTCWSKHVVGDGICDVECNTVDCKFDGGDCNFRYN
eukprot:g3047.t1